MNLTINFYEEVFEDDFIELISPKKFLNDMLNSNMLSEITDDYGNDIESLCRNAVSWIIVKLKEANINTDNITVMEGYFLGYEHVWLKINDKIYLDLTLAQFLFECPELAITLAEEVTNSEMYVPIKEMSIEGWTINELQLLFAENDK